MLWVGLGNPGPEHARQRHNIGFMAVDAIGDAHGFGPSRSRFRGHAREGVLKGRAGAQKVLLLKPMTYMNDSGVSVQDAISFHKIDLNDVFVIYDELDLPPLSYRIKTGGGAGGHPAPLCRGPRRQGPPGHFGGSLGAGRAGG